MVPTASGPVAEGLPAMWMGDSSQDGGMGGFRFWASDPRGSCHGVGGEVLILSQATTVALKFFPPVVESPGLAARLPNALPLVMLRQGREHIVRRSIRRLRRA